MATWEQIREEDDARAALTFEELYDHAVLRVMDAKAEYESAKSAAKEAKEALFLAGDNLQNLRRPKTGPRQIGMSVRSPQ